MPSIENKGREILARVVSPSDLLGHRTDLVKLGSLAAVGAVGAVSALAVAGRFGYEKWRNHKDQVDRLMSILIANRMLLSYGGEAGREAFIGNLSEILVGKKLDNKRKIEFLRSFTKDEPVDVYFKKGGLGVHKYEKDGAIASALLAIRAETIDVDLQEALDQTVDNIRLKKERLDHFTKR